MLVSVIIPVYNSENTIRRCVESVVISLEQITQDYEIICVDDGSSDNSLSLLKDIASQNERIIVVHQENAGAATARNRGLELSKGDFIAFNDSDDEWLENHFAVLLEVFKKYPEIDCICANHDIERQTTFFLKRIEENIFKVSLNAQQFKNRYSPPNSMISRKIIEFGVRYNSILKGSEEFYFFNHILHDFNCLFLNQKVSQSILHKARFGESGLSGNLKEMEKGELFSICDAWKTLGVNFFVFCAAYVFSLLKYARRKIIVKARTITGEQRKC